MRTSIAIAAVVIALIGGYARRTVAEDSDDDAELDGPELRDERRDLAADLGGLRDSALGPPVAAVLAAAYRAAGLDDQSGRGWVLRARLAGLVPWVTVRTGRDKSWQDERSEIGHGASFEVRATWRLDRLLFDGRELQIASIEAARRRERQRLAPRVIRAYFAWQRIAAGPGSARSVRLAESVAELDALTDGWFSEELARDHRATRRER